MEIQLPPLQVKLSELDWHIRQKICLAGDSPFDVTELLADLICKLVEKDILSKEDIQNILNITLTED